MNKENDTENIPEEKKEVVHSDLSLEKITNDLFDYRVDIKSYKMSLNSIIIAGSILVSILAFFGYNKIENIETTIMEKANKRLTVTDSLLAKIDQSKIDSLNFMLLKKEQEYLVTIANFERIIQQSKDLQLKLLESLSENTRIDSRNDSYTTEHPTDIFILHDFKKELPKNKVEYIYLTFKDEVTFSPEDYLSIRLYPKERRILLLNKDYKIDSKFNKLSFGIEPFENYKEYTLEVAYFKKEKGKSFKRYYMVETIKLI